MNIIIKRHFLLYKGYKLKCCIGKSGLAKKKREGDLKTPKGLFELGLLYFRTDRIKSLRSKIQKKLLKKTWVGVMTAEVKNIIKKYVFHLNLERKGFIEKIKFMIFLLT